MSTKLYSIVVFIVVISILGAFYGGYFLKDLLSINNIAPIANNIDQKFKPNYIDEIIFVSKEKPYQTLILSAIRTYSNSSPLYNYTIKAFYFDGSKWSKNISEGKSIELDTIPKTTTVPKWEFVYDPSYMLKQSASGEVSLDNNKIEFNAPLLLNEMGIRSSPKYTKFMSEADGTLTINGKIYGSHVLYNRIYSFNAPESLITTDDPSGINTEWLAFWDTENNFYSIDETVIDNKKTLDSYKAHSMAVAKSSSGSIQKSFTLKLIKNTQTNYKVDILENINKTITVNRLNSINKAVNEKDNWITGQADGEIKLDNGKVIKGFGIYEQIYQ